MMNRCLPQLAAIGAMACFSLPVHASDRTFSYTYETAVLNPGDTELEPWTTLRVGRQHHFIAFDNRLELEAGVARDLQTAFYVNTQALNADAPDEDGLLVRDERFTFRGVSSEWKYKLSDPVADPIGSALYLEGGIGPHEAELELKVLVDKHLGNLVLAANLVGEYEQEWEQRGEVEHELLLELDVGAGYRLSDAFSAGLEFVQTNELEGGSELESSSLFAGPTVAYAGGDWWSVLTVLPQIGAFVGHTDNDFRDLEHQEKVQVRLLFGFHL